MEKDWIYFADTILKKIDSIYPAELKYPQMLKTDPHWQDYQAPTDEGITFLIHHNLIVEVVNGSNIFKCSSQGRMVAKIGIENFIEEMNKKNNEDQKVKNLSLELLQQQIIDIKRKNRNWRWAVVAGVVSFVYNLLQVIFYKL